MIGRRAHEGRRLANAGTGPDLAGDSHQHDRVLIEGRQDFSSLRHDVLRRNFQDGSPRETRGPRDMAWPLRRSRRGSDSGHKNHPRHGVPSGAMAECRQRVGTLPQTGRTRRTEGCQGVVQSGSALSPGGAGQVRVTDGVSPGARAREQPPSQGVSYLWPAERAKRNQNTAQQIIARGSQAGSQADKALHRTERVRLGSPATYPGRQPPSEHLDSRRGSLDQSPIQSGDGYAAWPPCEKPRNHGRQAIHGRAQVPRCFQDVQTGGQRDAIPVRRRCDRSPETCLCDGK